MWGHRINLCFILCQLFWIYHFMKRYPKFCGNVAKSYEAYNTIKQRTDTVQMLHSVKNLSTLFLEEELL